MTFFGYTYFLFYFILQWPASFATTCNSCSRISFNVKNGLKDRALEDGRMLKNTIVENDSQCFVKCSEDCKCLSFNVCGKTCQLNGANRLLARNSLRVNVGCRYYDLPTAESTCERKSSGPPGICCARLSYPCFNGGSCDVNISDVTRRFICKCPPGYYGDQCGIKKPKSCLDYWTGAIKPVSRDYMLEDQAGNSYQVFCDFDSEERIAWTLIESFAMSNEDKVKSYPLTVNYPLNEAHLNWDLFRISKTAMQYIVSRSTFWRGTCSYPIYGVDFRDYLRMRVSLVDPTVLDEDAICIQIDFIDGKGTRCFNCTITIVQRASLLLHTDPYFSRVHQGCSFDSSSVEYVCVNNNQHARWFGCYWPCHDPSYIDVQRLHYPPLNFGLEK